MSTRRQQERERTKKTAGFWVWRVAFIVFYPIIAVFTFAFTTLLNVLSAFSRGLAWLLEGRKA